MGPRYSTSTSRKTSPPPTPVAVPEAAFLTLPLRTCIPEGDFKIHLLRREETDGLGVTVLLLESNTYRINKIIEGGLVLAWNEKNHEMPEIVVNEGDVIVAVNGIFGDGRAMKTEMARAKVTLTIRRRVITPFSSPLTSPKASRAHSRKATWTSCRSSSTMDETPQFFKGDEPRDPIVYDLDPVPVKDVVNAEPPSGSAPLLHVGRVDKEKKQTNECFIPESPRPFLHRARFPKEVDTHVAKDIAETFEQEPGEEEISRSPPPTVIGVSVYGIHRFACAL
eukprot:TRINITY_DN101034_c0_g1_i1.p1 TRINITY_DN101034_c0_g1~~TRINITY_DN101034_c0_g1_i1.p1  ORF type:complete len:280 (-),score=28.31 TRINITY_DN101034_c0_g1_i1:502-1341(-)